MKAMHLLPTYLPINLTTVESASRREVECFIADRFYKSYLAKVDHFLPYLLSISIDNQITSALGFQPAAQASHLFLEYYLTCPVEAALSLATASDISRDKIVEIGNLAALPGGSSQILLILVANILYQAGYEWVVFTANYPVKRMLQKLQLFTLAPSDADPHKLPDKGASWGNYYQHSPVLLAGRLSDAVQMLNQYKAVHFLIQNYQSVIDDCISRSK